MDNLELDVALKSKLQYVKTDIPPIVKESMNKAFSAIPKTKSNKLKYSSIAASAVFLCLIVTSFFSPSSAKALSKIPLIGPVFQLVGDTGLNFASKNNISTSINKSKTDKGIKITVTDVLYDGTRIAIGYTMESEKGVMEVQKSDIYIDGKKLSFTSSSSGNAIGSDKYAGIINVSPEIKVPDKFSIDLNINKVGDIEGDWDFRKIPVKYQGTKLNSKTLMPMVSKPFENGNIVIRRTTLTDASTEVEVYGYNASLFGYNLQIFDDKNISIEPRGSSGNTEDGVSKIVYKFDPIPAGTKSLYFKVFRQANTPNDKIIDVKKDITGQYPIILDQGDGGKITIDNIEYLQDKTLVHYNYSGANPYGSGVCLWLEDEKGKDIKNPTVAIKRTDETSYSFVMECFPSDKNKKLKICTSILPGIKNVLEFNIPIQ